MGQCKSDVGGALTPGQMILEWKTDEGQWNGKLTRASGGL